MSAAIAHVKCKTYRLGKLCITLVGRAQSVSRFVARFGSTRRLRPAALASREGRLDSQRNFARV